MQQRSNTATRVRKTAGPSIFNCRPADLDTMQKRIENFQGKIGWVPVSTGGSSGKGRYDHWAVEILHENYRGSFDINSIFRSPILLRVRCFLSFFCKHSF